MQKIIWRRNRISSRGVIRKIQNGPYGILGGVRSKVRSEGGRREGGGKEMEDKADKEAKEEVHEEVKE